MKHTHKAQDQYVPNGSVSKDIRSISLSEPEILTIQHYFLTPGFHCLRVADVPSGRALLRALRGLVSADVQPAVLSLVKPDIDSYITLFDELNTYGACTEPEKLQQFMATAFYYDFLIIEGTHELLQTSWFAAFEQLILEYDIMNSTPILMLVYG